MANSNLERLRKALENLATLDIVTVVGPVSVSKKDGKLTAEVRDPSQASAMQTSIDLIGGDICNQIDSAYTTGDLTSLRDFHLQQVKAGHDIIVNNFKAMIDLFKVLGDAVSGSQEE